jgi:hypothetical protein
MATKSSRGGKKKARTKRVAKAKPTRKAKSVAKAKPTRKAKSVAKAKPAKPIKTANTKRAAKAKPVRRAAKPKVAMSRAAAPREAAPAVSLYDLVCPDEGLIEAKLDFATCMAHAQAHNDATGHSADCFQRKP